MIRLTVENIKEIYALIVKETGGSYGIREESLLASACEGIFQTFECVELYPSIEEKGAMLGYSLISCHSFVDGNKRIGILAMLTFLSVNGVDIECTDEEIVSIGLGTASGKISYEGLLDWIIHHECIGESDER